jgi:4-amino-4-deoxy-L-arabinose transferase-like glycosyltransferase
MNDPSLQSRWERLLARDPRPLLVAVLVLNSALCVWTALGTLRNFPNSADEYACVLSAELMSRGALSAPSPEPRDFFNLFHVINDGKFYGKYPPGWPGLLSLGMRTGAPWLVNPLVGLAIMGLVYQIARRAVSREAATIALLLMAGNPFLVFNAASYFSHTACLLSVLAFIACFFGVLANPGSLLAFAGMGLAAGAGFLIRPYTMLLAALPLGLYLLWYASRPGATGSWTRGLCLASTIFAVLLQVFFLYNRAQTGDPFLQPFALYDPFDTLGFSGRHDNVLSRIRETIVVRGLQLLLWLPAAPILILCAIFLRSERPAETPERLLVASFLALYLGYFLYWGPGVNQYGPRYLLEGAGALIVAAAAALSRRRRLAPFLVLGAILLNAGLFVQATIYHRNQVRERTAVYDLVRYEGLSRAVVFLKTGSGTMPAADLTRNGVLFEGSVLFVHDRGKENARLLAAFPGRKAYRFEYDLETGRRTLTPIGPEEAGKP